MVILNSFENAKEAFNGLLDIFYPRVCVCCGNVLNIRENQICFYCYHKLPFTNFHLYTNNPVEKVFWGRYSIEKGTAFLYFSKGGIVQNLIHNVKYRQQWDAGYLTGALFGKSLLESDFLNPIDWIVPIPLNPKKLEKRGYNQSTCFGMGFSKETGIPLNDNNLIRTKNSASQTLRGRFNRWENVNEIFELKETDLFKNCHILLFDDVITTGATLEAAARILGKVPGVRVSIATIGFASRLP